MFSVFMSLRYVYQNRMPDKYIIEIFFNLEKIEKSPSYESWNEGLRIFKNSDIKKILVLFSGIAACLITLSFFRSQIF